MSHPDPRHDPTNVRIEDSPHAPTACPECGGIGTIQYPPGPGWYADSTDDCTACDGTGREPELLDK